MVVENFTGISYESWKETCDMYLSTVTDISLRRSFAMYLQLYPFTRITSVDKTIISSKDFYDNFIKSGAILYNDSVLKRSNNLILKNNGGFRDAQLLSPLMFLILQAIGVEICKRYRQKRETDENIVAFYAGNFLDHKSLYKSQYQEFSKWNNYYAEEYPYFIKTDLSDYFSNIKFGKLLNLINNNVQAKFTPIQQKTIIDILNYCGDSKFPLVQNSTASSFLATIVYLDIIDVKLGNFIKKLPNIEAYKLIRYVDDLYIWLKPKTESNLNQEYNDIRAEYSSILNSYGLTLNTKKTGLYTGSDIDEKLKWSIYNDVVNEQGNAVEMYLDNKNWTENVNKFITSLFEKKFDSTLTKESFQKIINNSFKSDDIVGISGDEIFKRIIYDHSEYLQDDFVIENMSSLLVRQGISTFYMSPQILTTMVLNTSPGKNKNIAVKSLLNQLFIRNKNQVINRYDIVIALQYLLNTGFSHYDLKEKIINRNEHNLYLYIKKFCCQNFLIDFKKHNDYTNFKIINGDWKTYYLYFNYYVEISKKQYMEAYAYFKTYFDRMTALIAAYKNNKKLNVNKYFKTKQLEKFYETIIGKNVGKTLEKAGKLRNKNPLVHSSMEMVDWSDWTEIINKMINDLNKILQETLTELKQRDRTIVCVRMNNSLN